MTLTNTNQPTLYPGMNCKGVEFFAVENEMKFIADAEIKCITKLPFGIIQLANEEIDRHPEVSEALQEWFPTSKFARVYQFLQCRYGGLDHTADFENNQFKDGDYFHCPKRATCKFNGILCKAPQYNGASLTAMDIQLMIHLSGNLTNETIADLLHIPFGSFHKYKQALYKKLGPNMQTKQEVALIAKSLNLI